eukprot:gene23460-biopygen7291
MRAAPFLPGLWCGAWWGEYRLLLAHKGASRASRDTVEYPVVRSWVGPPARPSHPPPQEVNRVRSIVRGGAYTGQDECNCAGHNSGRFASGLGKGVFYQPG